MNDVSFANKQTEELWTLHRDIVTILRLMVSLNRKVVEYKMIDLEPKKVKASIFGPQSPDEQPLTVDDLRKLTEGIAFLREPHPRLHEILTSIQADFYKKNQLAFRRSADDADADREAQNLKAQKLKAQNLKAQISAEIGQGGPLAELIKQHGELFYWFARAYSEWPLEDNVEPHPDSRHDAVFRQAYGYMNYASKWLSDGCPQTESACSSRTEHIHRSSLKYCSCALNVIPALKLEFERAVKLCEAATQQPIESTNRLTVGETDRLAEKNFEETDPRDDAANEWLYNAWQNERKTWAAIEKEYQHIRPQNGWPKVSSINGVSNRVSSYAKANNLELRKGKGGRPRRAH